ncbi:transporter [Gaetbulibacter aestuarii]|uniref:Transporter n=1 Tax=Gaetbulibacter aestuarii TaxID=1502358 RepID=A0ABW7MUF2_9FLAO
MNQLKKLVFTALFLSSFEVSSQEDPKEPLITDRPDATESPSTVPVGYLQVETGSFYTKNNTNSIKSEQFTYNTSLLRLGLLNNVELRLGWDFVENKFENTNAVLSGFNPLLLGTKLAIAKENNGWPEVGFVGHVYLPFLAGNDYKPETTGVDFRFSFAHTLNEKSSLSYNLGMAWGDDSPEASYIYTLSYGRSLTNALGFYAELYGNLPENSASNHYWDLGFTYLLSDNVQLDATVGSGITDGQDLLLSGGVSFRIPTGKK